MDRNRIRRLGHLPFECSGWNSNQVAAPSGEAVGLVYMAQEEDRRPIAPPQEEDAATTTRNLRVRTRAAPATSGAVPSQLPPGGQGFSIAGCSKTPSLAPLPPRIQVCRPGLPTRGAAQVSGSSVAALAAYTRPHQWPDHLCLLKDYLCTALLHCSCK